MKLQKTCLWKKVFATHPDELPDAMFLQDSSNCYECNGKNELCPDYVPIFEHTTIETIKLKHRAYYNEFDLVQKNGALERVR